MKDKQFLMRLLKTVIILVAVMFGIRFSQGGVAIALALYGVWAAMQNKLSVALACYMFFPFLVIANPNIVPKAGLTSIALRLGPVLITGALMLSSSKRGAGHHRLPLGGMIPFLIVAALASVGGHAPMIAFMKLANFLILLVGLGVGLKNIDKRPEEILKAREYLMAIAVIIIIGSALLLLVPQYGYVNTVNQIIRDHPELTADEVALIVREYAGVRLFAGITNQSQCLAILMPIMIAWVICDMLFVERRWSKFHLIVSVIGLPLIYMTRSRTSLLCAAVGLFMLYVFAIRRVPINPKVKRSLNSGLTFLMIIGACLAIYSEINNNSISRWIRKTDDLQGDYRSFGQALTSSRQGLIAESMDDFRQNPLIGMGFQVARNMKGMSGFVLSAPIEKGVLPIMILGETGILGFVAFLGFLVAFYGTCFKKQYVVTATLFTMLLAENMGEANFFSPGGPGGTVWVLGVGGGFLIDTIVIFHRRLEKQWAKMPLDMPFI